MKATAFNNDVRSKSHAELMSQLSDLQEKLRVLKLELLTGKSKNGAQARAIRRNIARIKTAMSQTR